MSSGLYSGSSGLALGTGLYRGVSGLWSGASGLDAGFGGSFTPASLTLAYWYDPSDLTTLFQDTAGTVPVTTDGQTVACINDKSGNGRNLTQATASQRPIYRTSGSLSWLEFDGTDDWLRATFTFDMPFDRVAGIRQISWVSGDRVFGSAGAVSEGDLLQNFVASPQLAIQGNALLGGNSGAAIGADAVTTERYLAGTNASYLQVNNGALTSGTLTSATTGGLTLGASRFGSAAANFRFYGVAASPTTLGATDLANLKAWMAGKAGIIPITQLNQFTVLDAAGATSNPYGAADDAGNNYLVSKTVLAADGTSYSVL